MYKIAIVEDEDKSAERLRKLINLCCEELQVECQIQRFKNGMDFITDYKPVFDLVLLDIEMPLLNGMDTARKLRKSDSNVFIIFITNLAQYAINGYEVDALDFILKPVEYKNFLLKFKKFLKIAKEKKENFIIINSEGITRKINLSNILYVEVINHFLYYHLRDETITEYGTIAKAESNLEQYGFCRIYKSFIVNLAHISEIKLNTVLVDDGTELLISRFKKAEFMKKVADYFGNGYFSGGGVSIDGIKLHSICFCFVCRLRLGGVQT